MAHDVCHELTGHQQHVAGIVDDLLDRFRHEPPGLADAGLRGGQCER
jgi:hypothetical protein